MTAASLRVVPPLSYLHLRSNPQPVSVMLLKSPRSYWTLMNIGSLTRYLSRVSRLPNLGGESVCTLPSVSLASKNLPADAGDVRDTGSGKEPACRCRRHKRHRFHPWVGKVPWRRAQQPTHCSILAWKIPWTEEPGGLQPIGLRRVGHD